MAVLSKIFGPKKGEIIGNLGYCLLNVSCNNFVYNASILMKLVSIRSEICIKYFLC
jgi:hypothetical protein